MRPIATTTRLATIALAAVAALITLAPAAFADHDHGRGHAWGRRDRQYWAQPVFAAPPAWTACAPRYVVYRPQRVAIVRPAPYVRIGGRIGQVDVSAVFGPHANYTSYDYGCNFCDAHFSSFGAYEDHVEHCAYRPANVRIVVRSWDDDCDR